MNIQDLSYCTATSFKALENKYKALVFKELRKVWEISDPNCPWAKGDYNESNTVLLDDSPYKALLNPVSLPNSCFLFPFTPLISLYHLILNSCPNSFKICFNFYLIAIHSNLPLFIQISESE